MRALGVLTADVVNCCTGQWETFFSRFAPQVSSSFQARVGNDVGMAGSTATSPQDAQNQRFFPGPDAGL